MRIRMTAGRTVHYMAGQVYDDSQVSAHHRQHFLANGWAEPVEAKSLGRSPENKMLAGAQENKATGACPHCGKHFKRGLHFHVAKCKEAA